MSEGGGKGKKEDGGGKGKKDSDKKPVSKSGFQTLGLPKELLRGILNMGYKVPTPVQRKTLPLALAGQDLVCMARTGSGKTAAFLVPLMVHLGWYGLRTGRSGWAARRGRHLA
jgi:ATP-dependent RNA helicase DDX54/DBP10